MMHHFRKRLAEFIDSDRRTDDGKSTLNLGQSVGWADSKLYSGTQFPKYNPDDLIGRRGHQIYKAMMRDEQVKAVVHFKRDAITSRDFVFELDKWNEHMPETEVTRRIDIYHHMMDEYTGSFADGLNAIMKAMWQGFSMTEKKYEYFDYLGSPYVGIRQLRSKPFESFKFYADEYGDLIKIEQEMAGMEQLIDLDRFVYFVQNPDVDEHYGQSELREAYRSWFSKDAAIRFSNIFLERMAGGLPVITTPKTMSSGSPEYRALQQVIETLQSVTSIMLPEGVELDLKSPQTTDQFEKHIVLHDLQIAKALLVPNLLGITHAGQTGSFSQSQVHLRAFFWTLDADKDRLEDALNEQVFDPLHRLNFADGIGPRFRFKPISDERTQELIAKWKELISVGAVEATDTDELHIRDLLDFPEKGEPIKKPEPAQPVGQPGQPGQPEDEPPDETVAGQQVRVVSGAAFERARKRVAISVIDRKTTDILERHVPRVAERVEDVVAAAALRVIDEDMGTPAAKTDITDLKLDSKLQTKLRSVVTKMLEASWQLGERHALTEVNRAKREVSVDMARLGDAASEFLRQRGIMIVGDLTDSILKTVRGMLANAVKYSWTPRETVRRVYDRLTLAGYVYVETNASVTGRTVGDVLEAIQQSTTSPVHHIRTVVRTNSFEALNEARFNAFTDPELDGFVEALEYSAILDSRTTDVCRHLDERVYPVDAPEWDVYRPPNHFNCRSVLVPVTVIDTEVTGRDNERGSRWSRAPRVEPQSGFGGGTG